jgi:branched-chain amino acid transport system permease protein
MIGIAAGRLWPGGPELADDRSVYWYALGVTVLVVTATAATLRSRAGLLLRACRDNELRMRTSGHPVTGYLLVTHVAVGAVAGIGGGLLVTVQRFVSPADVGFGVSALVLLAVITGGAASLWGALGGAALVVTVRDWATAGVPGHGPLVLGVLFIVAVFVLPQGLAGALTALARTVGRRIRGRGAAT